MNYDPKPTDNDLPHNCPHCNSSLLDSPIPAENKSSYSGNYFKREVGWEFPDLYDGVYYWECPDCKGQWGGYRAMKETR